MSELSTIKFSHPAGIITRALGEDELLALAKLRAPKPEVFEEYPPLFFSAESTNNRLDSYFTRMMPSSLKNYAAESAEGVSFQDSHQTGALSFMMGRTLTGEYKGAQGNGVARVVVDIYTLQNHPDTSGFITKYQTGIARDVSIGFYGGRFICSICGLDMMTWDCWHYPGHEYEVEEENDDKSKTVRKVVATADVEDAHLAEVSAVYKGATPGAVILKALRDVEEGRMKPEVARLLEQRYRYLDLNLSYTRRAFPGHQRDTTVATPTFTIGDRVEVEGKPHMENQKTGEVKMAVSTTAYGVVFDGMEEMGIHRWYIEDELVAAQEAGGSDMEPMRTRIARRSTPGHPEENANMSGQNRETTTGADPAAGTGDSGGTTATTNPPPPPADTPPPAETTSTGGAEPPAGDPPPPSEETAVEITSEEVRAGAPLVRSMLKMAGVTEQTDLTVSVRELLNAARDGRTYRADLIEKAHAEGVRAQGPAYKREQHDKIFRSADLDYIKLMTEEWARIAKEKFPGGRQSQDVGQSETDQVPPPAIPDSAYKVRSY